MSQIALDAVRNYLTGEPDVSLAYVFGSQASGLIGPLSDYDIGLLVEPSPGRERRYRLHRTLLRLLKADRLDLVFLDEAPVELAYAVIAKGQLLYQQDLATRVEFEACVLSRYGDYVPILKAQREVLLHGETYDSGIQRYREALRRTERTLAALRAHERETTA